MSAYEEGQEGMFGETLKHPNAQTHTRDTLSLPLTRSLSLTLTSFLDATKLANGFSTSFHLMIISISPIPYQ